MIWLSSVLSEIWRNIGLPTQRNKIQQHEFLSVFKPNRELNKQIRCGQIMLSTYRSLYVFIKIPQSFVQQ